MWQLGYRCSVGRSAHAKKASIYILQKGHASRAVTTRISQKKQPCQILQTLVGDKFSCRIFKLFSFAQSFNVNSRPMEEAFSALSIGADAVSISTVSQNYVVAYYTSTRWVRLFCCLFDGKWGKSKLHCEVSSRYVQKKRRDWFRKSWFHFKRWRRESVPLFFEFFYILKHSCVWNSLSKYQL